MPRFDSQRHPAELRTLANGLRVVLAPREAESVAFGLFVESGSRHESAATAGISHFIEHMLFKGTATRRAVDLSRAIEGRGGHFNACTGEESTCYYAHLPSEYLADAVEVLSDMYLNAALDPEEFEREKAVVIEEIRMYADEPDAVAAENLQRALFPRNRLGAPVAGTAASLRPLTPAVMRRYLQSHYLSANTLAVLVGDFDPEVALRLVDAALGPRRFRRCGRVPRAVKVDFAVPPVPERREFKDVQQAQLALGFRTFGLGDPRHYAAVVADSLLGRGMSSRLFQEVREKRGLSYDIASRMGFFRDAGTFAVTAGLEAGKAESALRTIERELARLARHAPSAAELRRIQDFMVGNARLSREKTVSRLFYYGNTVMAFGRVMELSEQLTAIRAVTAADVRDVAAAIFRPEARSVSWVLPRG